MDTIEGTLDPIEAGMDTIAAPMDTIEGTLDPIEAGLRQVGQGLVQPHASRAPLVEQRMGQNQLAPVLADVELDRGVGQSLDSEGILYEPDVHRQGVRPAATVEVIRLLLVLRVIRVRHDAGIVE